MCADEACTERLEMTADEYSSVREKPIRFAVFPSEEHVFLEVEQVMSTNPRYWVVEKFGEAASVAANLDPRSRGDGRHLAATVAQASCTARLSDFT